MKTLVLVRHGKASHSHPELEDLDRPLNHRGKKDSVLIAERFHELGIHIHAIISSPALRAKTTAKEFGDWLVQPIEIDDRLFNATVADWLDVVQQADDFQEAIVLVGHNSGISEFLRRMTGSNLSDMPTASVAVVDFDVPEWTDITAGSGSLECFLDPGTPGEQSIAV